MKNASPYLDMDMLSASGLLDTLADGAYITDRERRIVFWNAAAEKITGWSRDEVLGKHCADNILVHIDKDGHPLCGHEYCPLHRCIVTGEKSAAPLLLFAQSRSGERVPVEVTVSPIRDRTGKIVGGIEMFRDMGQAMDDLERARRIQEHALQSKIPRDERMQFAAHYIPCELTGGDFYRVEQLDDDHYGVLVADVSGHGIPSALYTMQLRSLWEDCRDQLNEPQRFIATLNERLYALTTGEDYFATAVHLVVNAATGEVRYAKAGHPSPFLVHEGEASLVEGPNAPGLGLFPQAKYGDMTVHLEAGDSLLLYTDGASEVMDAENEELGETGLGDLVSRVDLSRGVPALEAIEEALLKYSNSIRLPDDLTLVSLHRLKQDRPQDET